MGTNQDPRRKRREGKVREKKITHPLIPRLVACGADLKTD